MSTETVYPIQAAGTAIHEFASDVVITARTDVADHVVALDLAKPDGASLPSWLPGAHIDLLLGNGLVRQYSLCGDPDEADVWRIGVLLDPRSRGGSRFVHDYLIAGCTVRVRGPRNHFPLIDSPSYLFIAGGIGITPMMPMIRAAQQSGSDWRLIYLGRSSSTMAFASELAAAYGDRVLLWPDDVHGIFDLGSALAQPLADTLVYCCGPEPLLAAVETHFAQWPPGSLHLERFAAKPPTQPSADALDTFDVVCRRSGVTVEVPAESSILEALEDADIPIMSSCLEGVCGTCEASVVEGIPDHRDSMLTEAERTAGNVILTCVSRSRSQTLVLDL